MILSTNMNLESKNLLFRPYLQIPIILLPLLVFVYFLIFYSTNIPWLDDIEVGPLALHQWIQSTNFMDKLDILWAPNNEHRIVILKLMVVLNYYVFHQFNIQWLIWQSHLYLIPFLWIIVAELLPKKNRFFYFLPIPFLLFNFQYYLSTYWMIAALQHNYVIGFGILTVYTLAKNKSFTLPILLMLLTCLSNTDGLIFIPIGACMLFLQFRIKEMIAWIIFAASFILILFLNHPTRNHHGDNLVYFLDHPLSSLQGLFVFMGAFMDFFPQSNLTFRLYFAAVFGLLMLLSLWIGVATIVKKIKKNEQVVAKWKLGNLLGSRDLILFGTLSFFILNAITISVLRVRSGDIVFLSGNYKIYPVLSCIIIYLLVSPLLTKSHVSGIIGFSVLFWICSIFVYSSEIRKRNIGLKASYKLMMNQKGGLGFSSENIKKFQVIEVLKEFEKNGIYNYSDK